MVKPKEITVVFRYDDFSSLSPISVDSNLIEIFGKHHFTCTVGVTPFVTSGEFRNPAPSACIPLDQARIGMLRDGVACGAIDVALHGYDHRTIGARPLHSEFSGLEFYSQLEKITRGRMVLEEASGAPITVFIPPWNTYDQNTLRALQEAGMGCISANRYGPVDLRLSLTYLPITIELQDLRKALAVAMESADTSPAVVVLMHPYDFKESKDRRSRFSAMDLDKELAWLATQRHAKVCSVSEVHHLNGSISPDRYIANAPFSLEEAAPPYITRTENRVVYLSLKKAKQLRLLNQLNVAAFYLTVAIVCSAIGYIVGEGLGAHLRSLAFVPALIMTIVLMCYFARSALTRHLSLRRMLFSTIGFGLLSGYFIADLI